MEEILQPAGTTYKDWVGSAAAESSMVVGAGDLYELAGLNREDWTVLAIDMHTFSHGKPARWTVAVFAANRRELGVGSYDAMKELEVRQGSIPVTEFRLHNVSIEEVVRCMKVLHVQLTSSNFRTLRIVDKTDFPPGD